MPSRVVTAEEALEADLVVLATTASSPWVPVDTPLRPGQVLLNVSLRDLPPEMLLRANNIVDDVDHCPKARTSPHLAEQLTGGREFVTGTLPTTGQKGQRRPRDPRLHRTNPPAGDVLSSTSG